MNLLNLGMLLLGNNTTSGTTSEFDATQVCDTTSGLWGLLGIAIVAIKVVIPIVLIVFGMLDMGKAVTSGKDDEIKKQLMSFMRRAIAAVLVFFVPTIVGMLMQIVNDATTNGAEGNCGWAECIQYATGAAPSDVSCQKNS